MQRATCCIPYKDERDPTPAAARAERAPMVGIMTEALAPIEARGSLLARRSEGHTSESRFALQRRESALLHFAPASLR